ncbi:hypothetical protein GGR21_003231 [Dysgonomonas hofstadii]|uniref:Alpha/beta hydrolase n=1 Tax=Dysgonomonas hofstadii TaxID=637886 RepID=A0A840CUE9_9BACT|nr:DUF6051 family protein [Dysgonomonas hofstadii]MBB4037314.1 hypothetical protein [Dysgonomonas hofstadii]
MKYIDLYDHLRKIENYTDNEIDIDENLVIRNFTFESNYRFILPGGLGNNDDYEYIPSFPKDYEPDVIQQMLNKKDSEIAENIKFRYHIMMPKNIEKAKGIIFLFHGFNEKTWYKYLPWAKYIVDKTGKSIVMFPIAFHMNRAPATWSSTREMYRVSEQRKQRHPDVICSSLSNVAISTRLHNKPQRFIWSGLQTYYDVIDFVENFKEGLHPAIDKDATIDFFSYSIGTFLGEILMMSNKDGHFSDSRYATFCGGAVFNRLTPVSRFILDSEANVSLYSFVVEHLESHMKRDEVLRHYMHTHPEGNNFRSMLNYRCLTGEREQRFKDMSQQFYAVTLAKDEVVPTYEVVNTLQGSLRDIPIKIEELDYPYKYIHEDPFPAIPKIADIVDEQYRMTFEKISEFLK